MVYALSPNPPHLYLPTCLPAHKPTCNPTSCSSREREARRYEQIGRVGDDALACLATYSVAQLPCNCLQILHALRPTY